MTSIRPPDLCVRGLPGPHRKQHGQHTDLHNTAKHDIPPWVEFLPGAAGSLPVASSCDCHRGESVSPGSRHRRREFRLSTFIAMRHSPHAVPVQPAFAIAAVVKPLQPAQPGTNGTTAPAQSAEKSSARWPQTPVKLPLRCGLQELRDRYNVTLGRLSHGNLFRRRTGLFCRHPVRSPREFGQQKRSLFWPGRKRRSPPAATVSPPWPRTASNTFPFPRRPADGT